MEALSQGRGTSAVCFLTHCAVSFCQSPVKNLLFFIFKRRAAEGGSGPQWSSETSGSAAKRTERETKLQARDTYTDEHAPLLQELRTRNQSPQD